MMMAEQRPLRVGHHRQHPAPVGGNPSEAVGRSIGGCAVVAQRVAARLLQSLQRAFKPLVAIAVGLAVGVACLLLAQLLLPHALHRSSDNVPHPQVLPHDGCI